MQKANLKILIISLLSLSYAFFLISPVLSTLFKTPPHTINMLVGHYFEDYYEYLSFIKQGQMGHLLVQNLFTNEDFHTYFAPWWPYSLIGFLTYLIKIPIPVHLLYWLACITLLFFLFLIIYASINALLPKETFGIKFSTFLLTIFSCDFFTLSFDKGLHIIPIDYWYSIASPFSRFGTATPHHEIIQISLLLSLLFLIKNYQKNTHLKQTGVFLVYIGFFVSSLLLLFLSPPQYILFLGGTFISLIIYTLSQFRSSNPKLSLFSYQTAKNLMLKLYPFILSSLLLIPFIGILWQMSENGPTYLAAQLWEKQNLYYPPYDLFIKASGPLLIFTFLGLYVFLKNLNFGKLLYSSVSLLSFIITLFPLPSANFNILTLLGFHNLRFTTPITYIFMSLVTVGLLKSIFHKSLYRYIAVSILIIYFLPSLATRWEMRSADPYSAGFLQMMPADLYDGIAWLEHQKTDGTILASPASYIGLIAPTIAGKRVYFGRSIFTLNKDSKYQKVHQFYSLEMTKEDAAKFLKKEHLNYIILSNLDGDKNHFIKTYPFLHEIFHNSYLSIYSPDI